jgi:hypothetical protein
VIAKTLTEPQSSPDTHAIRTGGYLGNYLSIFQKFGAVASKPFYGVIYGIKINLTAWQSEGNAEIFPPHPLNFFVRQQYDGEQHHMLVPNLK